MALSEGLLKLRWNNHEATFCHILHRLRSKPRYSDATLACEGRLFMVHRLVLATCSDFFDEIFQQTPSDNTRAVIVLNEARAQDVECLLDYMYCGQVNVRQSNLASLLKTAECLKIKGLAVPEAAVTPPSHSKRNQGYTPEQAPAKKKRKKKVEESTGHSTNTNPSPHIVPSTSLSSSPWIPTSMTTTAVSNMQCPSPPTISIPNTSSPLALPLLQASSPTNPITAPLRVTTQVQANEDDKANQKAGWLQIVSSMRQGTASTQLPPESSTPNQQQSNHSSLSNRAQVKMSEGQGEEILEPHLGQLLPIKEELKEEPVSVPLGPDDPLADEENSWGDPEQNHESEGIMYHKVSALHPPPGLHPVTSEGSINHTSVLPLGFLRMAPYAVHSGGQAWENAMPLSQSPEPLSQEASPSASQQAMDLGLDHLISLNKKGSPVHQATMSPKLMPYAMCSNCGTNNTKLWRRNDKGEIVCNACGLYFKLHGINRPSHLFRTAPMTRRRNPKKKKETETMGTEQLEPVISDSSQDKETVPETDPQDGLAVLNAALTLNTLLAKAKAHQAAAREALAAQGVTSPATNKSSSEQSCESRPPPPPLLKIPVMASETDAAPSAQTASETARDNSPVELSETEAEMIASPVDPGGTEPQSMQPPPSPPPLDEGRKFIAQLLDK